MHVGRETVNAEPGHLFEFDPGERHEVEARSDARLLLLLTPWPGAGHPGDDDARARRLPSACELPSNGVA